MKKEAITHGGSNRRYQICRCSVCGLVERCTPGNDFYTLGRDTTGPLHCERCFANAIHVAPATKEEP
jgi:hypothetical protein